MSIITRGLFWGYLGDQGRIYVKRYTSDRQIENYERLPFVRGIFDPFQAWGMAEAQKKIAECFLNEKKAEQLRADKH